MESSDSRFDKRRRAFDIATGRALRDQLQDVSTFGPLEDDELEFYGPLGEMSDLEEMTEESGVTWAVDPDDLERGLPEPDDEDARASGAVWTGEFWRPAGRPPRPAHTRTPMCPSDFVMMEFTNVGWICPDCGVVRI